MSEPMLKNKKRNHPGFTLTELMVASAIAVIVVLGLSISLSDGQRGWNAMYNRVYSDVVTGSHIAARTFDRIVRKSSAKSFQIDSDGKWVEVYYYSDANSASIDRYARFSVTDNNDLSVEYGQRNPKEFLGTVTICGNVSSCSFIQTGRSMQMVLTLKSGLEELTTVTSAVMHN
jgi:prepilin-type N-terminal cleavage/methylation domain-containing protein